MLDGRAVVTGEFGGLGYITPNHMWTPNAWGYQTFTDSRALIDEYLRLWQRVYKLRDEKGMSAAVYTQISDVEEEANGLLTYDRAVEKIDGARMRAANTDSLPPHQYRNLIPSDGAPSSGSWRYTVSTPSPDWIKPAFDDTAWSLGNGAFGSDAPSGITIGTPWDGNDLWLRREFTVPAEGAEWPLISIEYGVDSDIYINGVLACSPEGFLNCIGLYELNTPAKATIKPGRNTIAVHVIDRHKGRRHYISLGLVDERSQ